MRRIALVVALLATASAHASVTITVDRLDPSDGGAQPPPNIVVADVLIDVSPDDVWFTAGFAANALNGARLLYAYVQPDPNVPYWQVQLVNPGPTNRFVCCASKPSPRDSDQRFAAAGAGVGPHMCHAGGPQPIATPGHVDLSWWTTLPPTTGSPSADGAIMRVAIDVSNACNGSQAELFPWHQAPPGYVPVLESVCNVSENGTYVGTWQAPQWVGIRWGLYAPDSAPCAGDLDCSRTIDLADLTLMLGSFGQCNGSQSFLPGADLDNSGCVTLRDLARFLSLFGRTCP